ncbi:putative sterile alpha motif domain-containing protein [Dioscorea sansibarensis]
MYSDRVTAGAKRSIKDRLNGGTGDDLALIRSTNGKRQRQSEDKWKHDLYEDDEEVQYSKSKVGPKDLRLKLQKKDPQQIYQGGKAPGVRDLREKLSGIVPAQQISEPKAKPVPESNKSANKNVTPVEKPVSETKLVSNPNSSRRKSQQKSNLSVDGLLQSLGLEKYSIIFQAEEIDMTALVHMNDDDLKALGIPMGPRKKILLALDSKA